MQNDNKVNDEHAAWVEAVMQASKAVVMCQLLTSEKLTSYRYWAELQQNPQSLMENWGHAATGATQEKKGGGVSLLQSS